MTLEDKLWLAVIGGLIGLITAIITSLLNKRWLADEVAQTSVIENQIEIYRSLALTVMAIHNDSLQLLAYIAAEFDNLKNSGMTKEQIQNKVREDFDSKLPDLLKRVCQLNEAVVFLPKTVLLRINELEDIYLSVFQNATDDSLRKYEEVMDVMDDVLREIRSELSKVMRRETSVSRLLCDIPSSGFFSTNVRKAVAEFRGHANKPIDLDS